MAKVYDDDEVTVTPTAKAAPKVYHDDDVTVSPTPAQPKPTETPGIGSAIMRGVNKYLPFGQQIEAVGRTLPVIGTGKSYGQNYGDIQSETAQAEAAHPVASIAGGTAGGVVSALTGGGMAKSLGTVAQLAYPLVEGTLQGAASGASDAASRGESVGKGALRGATTGAAVGAALPVAAGLKQAVGTSGVASRAAARSDVKLLGDVGTGAPKSMRDKLMGHDMRNPEKAQAEAVDLLRTEFKREAKNPKKLVRAVSDSVHDDTKQVNDIFERVESRVGKVDPAHAAQVLRKRQAELMESLDTQDEARALEPMIRKVERNIPKENPKPPSGGVPNAQPEIGPNEFDALDQHDIEYTPEQRSKFLDETGLPASIGNTKGATEVGTVASPVRNPASIPAPVESAPAKGFGGREMRREITKAQGKAASVAVGKKPSAQNRAASEYANALKDVLADHVEKGGDAETAQLMRDINAKTAAKMRILKIADYKAKAEPYSSGTRLAEIGKGIVKHTVLPLLGGGAVMTGHAGTGAAVLGAGALGYGIAKAPAVASEALAAVARSVRAGNPQAVSVATKAAIAAGVRPALINALVSGLGEPTGP